jgi:prepilin-type processing-associated H-X9-DG protein
MKSRNAVALAVSLALVAGAAGIILAQAPKPDPKEQQAQCLSHIRQLGLAMLMYANDWQERFPPADRWTDVAKAYRRNEAILRCPVDKAAYSYAMNHNLNLARLGHIRDFSRTVLIFESTAGKKNAYDVERSWPVPPRHPGGNCVAFADGHAVCTKNKPDFSMNPRGAK